MELWHNPRCTKSRQALALLEERGVEPQIRRYLDDPPSPAELEAALEALGKEPWEIARMGEQRARELALGDLPHHRERWIEVLAADPILIERPIAIEGGRARIGRPPEDVLDLVD
jgi:arsenate reductase